LKKKELERDAYTDVGGTIPWMESVEPSQDAYRDIGGRATQEAKAEQRPRKRLEQVFETRLDNLHPLLPIQHILVLLLTGNEITRYIHVAHPMSHHATHDVQNLFQTVLWTHAVRPQG